MKNLVLLFVICIISIQFISCNKKQKQEVVQENGNNQLTFQDEQKINAKVTFVELGSVNCIPCKQMQPVMKSIEEKYKGQVKVVFHDVWKDKAPAQQYGIQLIPTQVFLDDNGKEFFRHEGFFPEAEIDKLLESKGLKFQD